MGHKEDPRKSLLRNLAELERERGVRLAKTRAIIRAADRLEAQAVGDAKRIAHKVEAASGPAQEIREAEYMDAVDRRTRAAQAGAMARKTLAKLGG